MSGDKSFRQCGLKAGGHLFRGTTGFNSRDKPKSAVGRSRSCAQQQQQQPLTARSTDSGQTKKKKKNKKYGPAPTPSIPSKFQTLMRKKKSTPNAFGNRCARFAGKKVANPGPGSYDTTFVNTNEQTSLSKKGYGVGFVSKTNRFEERVEHELDTVPGPGYYYDPEKAVEALGRKDFCKAKTSANFSTPRKYRDQASMEKLGPGPGTYNTAKGDLTPKYKKVTASSAFVSRSKRGWNLSEDAPAPGSYNIELPKASSGGAAACFRSKTKRLEALLLKGMLQTPGPCSYGGASDDADNNRKAQIPLMTSTGIPLTSKKGKGKSTSSMFAPTTQDRFSTARRAAEEETPGPGMYDPPVDPVKRVSGCSSAFKTSGRKPLGSRDLKPGPAYYNPSGKIIKRSFHLNSHRNWV